MAIRKPQPVDIARAIKPVAEKPFHLASLIYGRSGTGKTRLSCTWPKPLLLLDIGEHGTDTVSDLDEVDFLSIDSWDTFENVYWYLKDEGLDRYKTIVIDQTTGLQTLLMGKLRTDNKKTETTPLTKRDWGNLSSRLQTWFGHYRDLVNDGLHVVFIAHERADLGEDNEDGQIEPSIGARLIPSVSTYLSGAVDLIGNTFIREEYEGKGSNKTRLVQYCLRVGPHAYYATKIRRPPGDPLPEFLVDPTFDRVARVIRHSPSKPRRKVIHHGKN